MLAILKTFLRQEVGVRDLIRIRISADFLLLQGTALLPTPHFEFGARSGSFMQQGSSGKLQICPLRQ